MVIHSAINIPIANYLMAMLAFVKLDLSRDNNAIERDDRHRESLYGGLE